MRKSFLCIFLALLTFTTHKAQTRGTKVGYIDMEYILQNVPSYMEAQTQLEQKAEKWKQEIETKKTEINKLKDALKSEKALLTKSLIEERNSEIAFQENELLEYQQKRFGPSGDLMTQKNGLTKPIQDQVFSIVRDIAEVKKYDFIFDKTSDLTMLFAEKRYDISDQVIRALSRTEKREQLTKKQLQEEAEKEAKEEAAFDNPQLAKKQQALDAKKTARDAAIANRLLAEEEKRKVTEERKQKILDDRAAKKNGTTVSGNKTVDPAINSSADKTAVALAAKQAQAEQRAKILEDRKKVAEENKKAQEDKRQQLLSDRAVKKTNTGLVAPIPEQNTEKKVENEAETKQVGSNLAAQEEKQKQADAKAKLLEDRKKVAEENKKAQEERRQQILSEREAKKTTASPVSTISEKNTENETKTKQVVNKTIDKEQEAKQKQVDARAKVLEDRKKVAEENRKALEDKRKQTLGTTETKKNGTISENEVKVDSKKPTPITNENAKTAIDTTVTKQTTAKSTAEETKLKQSEARAKVIADKNKEIEDRKKALEEKRKKILEERQATKKPQ